MNRIFLVANDPSARKEEWVDAVTVQEAGPLWEFRDSGGLVIRRIPKIDVQSFTVNADRRQKYLSKKRRTYADQPQVDLASPVRRPVREKAVESSSRRGLLDRVLARIAELPTAGQVLPNAVKSLGPTPSLFCE